MTTLYVCLPVPVLAHVGMTIVLPKTKKPVQSGGKLCFVNENGLGTGNLTMLNVLFLGAPTVLNRVKPSRNDRQPGPLPLPLIVVTTASGVIKCVKPLTRLLALLPVKLLPSYKTLPMFKFLPTVRLNLVLLSPSV